MDDEHDGADPPDMERRASQRHQVVAHAILRRDGSSSYRATVFDLTENGCKAEMVERLEVADRIWVKFDGLEAIHASVSWVARPVAGIQFDRPIYGAVFDALMRRLAPRG